MANGSMTEVERITALERTHLYRKIRVGSESETCLVGSQADTLF